MNLPLPAVLLLYALMLLFVLFALFVGYWQWMVLRGRAMRNPDGSCDAWREQKILYGMALADICIAAPATLAGAGLALAGLRPGFYLLGMASFWFLWTNFMTTATSLRFERPKITPNWLLVFPFGAILGLVYILLSLVYFEELFCT